MRGVLSVGIVGFAALISAPAMAQMCGGGMQTQAQAQTQTNRAEPPAGMIMGGCGMGATAAADDPLADKPAQTQRRTGMCGCCQNMAMMQGMMGGQGMMGQGRQGTQGSQSPGMPHMPGMTMPGMQMPAQGDAKPSEPPKQP